MGSRNQEDASEPGHLWNGRPTLFLDVDGVLNTAQMTGRHALHPKLLKRLKDVCDATQCSVVLSTTWRLQKANEEVLLAALEKAGIPRACVVDHTPCFGIEELRWCGGRNLGETRRAAEIAAYLDAHQELAAQPFAIVDDIDILLVDSDPILAKLQGHFVRTAVESGLTERCCDKLKAILRPDLGGEAASAARAS